MAAIGVVLLAVLVYKQFRPTATEKLAQQVLGEQAALEPEQRKAMTSDKVKLANLKTDVRNVMSAQEEYFAAHRTYAPDLQTLLAANKVLALNYPGSAQLIGVPTGFEAAVDDRSITAGFNMCYVRVGTGTPGNADGLIFCNEPAPHRFSLSAESRQSAVVLSAGQGRFAAEGVCADVSLLGLKESRPRYSIHIYPCADSGSGDGFRYTAIEGERLYWDGGDSIARDVLALPGADTTDASKWPRFSIWGEGKDTTRVPRLLASRTMILLMSPR